MPQQYDDERDRQCRRSAGADDDGVFSPSVGTQCYKRRICSAVMATSSDESAAGVEQKKSFLWSLFAGIGSGTLASVVCAPLDLVRTRMQVMGDLRPPTATTTEAAVRQMPKFGIYSALRDIAHVDGMRGMFRGLGATLATVPAFWGIYFPIYEHLKRDIDSTTYHGTRQQLPPPAVVHMASAIVAGAAADVVCNPMFVVRTRMQTEALHYYFAAQQHISSSAATTTTTRKPNGLLETVRILYLEGGIPIFWRGFTASLLGLTHVAIQFPVYEWLKAESRTRSATNEESPLDLLLASGMSKMCASLLTYPHEVLRSRMMDYRDNNHKDGTKKPNSSTLVSTFRRVVSNEGYAALYTGLHVSLVRVIPNCCITFLTYELLVRWAKTNNHLEL